MTPRRERPIVPIMREGESLFAPDPIEKTPTYPTPRARSVGNKAAKARRSRTRRKKRR